MFRNQPINVNYLSARQICDHLTRFIRVHEVPSNEQTLNAALSDAGFVLLKLKEQLLIDNRYATGFPVELVSRGNNGMSVLLRVLMLLQRLHSQNNQRFSVLVNRSTTQRKKKAAVAEADCLECIKILLDKTTFQNSWAVMLDIPGNIELCIYSLNSAQLDSKCYALEICSKLLAQPSGFLLLLRSLTVTAAANRDENRLTPIIAQLKHGLHTGKLHIQILTVRFLNSLRSHAPSPNYSMLVQLEAENAGFSPERLERTVQEQRIGHGLNELRRELQIWRQSYHLPSAGATLPSTAAYPSHFRSNSAYVDESPLYAEYHQQSINNNNTNTSQRQRFGSFDQSDADGDTLRSRGRMYDNSSTGTSRSARHVSTAPVERQRARRLVDYDDRSLGMVHPSQQDTVRTSASSRDLRRSMESLSKIGDGFISNTQPRRNTTTRYSRSDSMPAPVSRARSEGNMQRIVQAEEDDHNYDRQPPSRRHAQFRSASVTPVESRTRDLRDYRHTPVGQRMSRSVHDLARISEEGSRPSSRQDHLRLEPVRPVQSVSPVTHTTTLTRVRPSADDEQDYDERDLQVQVHHNDDGSSVRRLAPQNGVEMELISPKPRVQGFSYLFPEKPVLDIIPKREQLQLEAKQRANSRALGPPLRARTPELLSLTGTPTSPLPLAAGRPQSAPILDPIGSELSGESLRSPSTTTSGRDSSNVVYIPVRVTGAAVRGVRRPASTTPYQQSHHSANHSQFSETDDVRDALSKFDYLNEYETSSRGSRF